MSIIKNKHIIIEIDIEIIKIVEIIKNKKSIYITNSDEIFLDCKYTDETRDQRIKNIKHAIDNYIKQNNIKTKKVLFTIQNEEILMRNINIPYIKNKHEAFNIIVNEVTKYLPINVEKYIVQYKIQDTYEENQVKMMNILVVFFPKEISQMYKEIAKELKLKPINLNINSNSIINISQKLNTNIQDKNNYTSIDIKNRFIDLNIIRNGNLKLYFRINKNYELNYNLNQILNNEEFYTDEIYYYGEDDREVLETIYNSTGLVVNKLKVDNINTYKDIEIHNYINNIGLII